MNVHLQTTRTQQRPWYALERARSMGKCVLPIERLYIRSGGDDDHRLRARTSKPVNLDQETAQQTVDGFVCRASRPKP